MSWDVKCGFFYPFLSKSFESPRKPEHIWWSLVLVIANLSRLYNSSLLQFTEFSEHNKAVYAQRQCHPAVTAWCWPRPGGLLAGCVSQLFLQTCMDQEHHLWADYSWCKSDSTEMKCSKLYLCHSCSSTPPCGPVRRTVQTFVDQKHIKSLPWPVWTPGALPVSMFIPAIPQLQIWTVTFFHCILHI